MSRSSSPTPEENLRSDVPPRRRRARAPRSARRLLTQGEDGLTLVELLVAATAGLVVLAAGAALVVPAVRAAEDQRRAGADLAVVQQVQDQLGRQVRDATSVTLASGGTGVTLCTFARPGATTRSVVTWSVTQTPSPTLLQVAGGRTTTFGDALTFAGVTFSQPAGAVASGRLSVTTSTGRPVGAQAGAHAPVVTTSASYTPRSAQKATCP